MANPMEHNAEPVPGPTASKKRVRPRSDTAKPCNRCKDQHLKCEISETALKCRRCERTGNDCVRSKKEFRFRDVPMSELRGQKSAKRTHKSVHKTLCDAATASRGRDSNHFSLVTEWLTQNAESLYMDPFDGNSAVLSHSLSQEPDSRRNRHTNALMTVTQETENSNGSRYLNDGGIGMTSMAKPNGNSKHSNSSQAQRAACKHYTESTSTDTQAEAKATERVEMSSDDTQAYIETILIRFFRVELAPWFDICDTFHHFANVVPQYLRQPGPLRDAVLTISARYLFNNQCTHSQSGMVQWHGHIMPAVNEELAISYHNRCIAELLKLRPGHEGLSEETLLAAVVVLRTDEEMMHQQEDKQVFLKVASLSIDAQLPEQLDLSCEYLPSEQSTTLNGLREACLLTSIRQDIHASLLAQQAIKFPLARCEAFRSLKPTSDLVWTNRAVVLCADVLELCFGAETLNTKTPPAYTDRMRWQALYSREEGLTAALPDTFSPVYRGEPNADCGDIFPSVFFFDTIHVSGAVYLELARLLIHVFNPDKPRLGLAAANAAKITTGLIKKSVLRLCGIALCNSDICPPSLVNASLAIALFGDYFENAREREALLGILSLIVSRHGYYQAAQFAKALELSWADEPEEQLPALRADTVEQG